MIIAYNKADIVGDTKPPHVADLTSSEYADLSSVDEILISAKTGQGIDVLRHLLCTLAAVDSDSSNGVIVSNLRHLSALNTALADIERVLDGLASGLPSDLISQDLRSCLYALGEITGGEIQTDEVLGNIFSHFCVGK